MNEPRRGLELSRPRRYRGRLNGERFLADPRNGVVHDLAAETAGCRVDGVFAAGCERPYGTLAEAYLDGYDGCPCCCGRAC